MPAKQAVTISDVARQAGLSVATVSRALNRSPKLDPQTAKRVFEAVEQLGYNAAPITGRATERSRMREKCYTVEVILSPQPEQKDMLQLNFFSNVYTGIQSFFLQAGNITTGLVTWDCSWGQISDLPPALTEQLKRADAIMLAGDLAVELTLALREFTPNLIAIFSNEMNTLPIDSVANNNFMAGMEAARLLIDNGFPEIGFLASPDRISSHELRLNGAMIQTTRSLGYDHFHFRRAKSTDDADIREAIEAWLSEPVHPSAFILPYARAASLLREIAAAHGLRCPDEISILCFDQPKMLPDHFLFTHWNTHPRKLGIKAAQRIVQRLLTPYTEDSAHCIMLPCELVPGDSVRRFGSIPSSSPEKTT